MDVLEEAMAVLLNAEQQLRSILVRSAKDGNYDHLPQIAEWAKLLSATLGGQPPAEPATFQPETVLPLASSDDGVAERPAAVRARAPATGYRKARAGQRRKRRRSKTAKSGYPKFVREGDSLVKIGWSKTDGKPYEHKAPRSVLRSLVQALLRVGSGGARFTVEGLLPLKDTAGTSEIPDYQTYLTLAWLRCVRLITQHGRQGYSLPNAAELERQSEQQWGNLTAR
jgi:hypothetical protein